MKPMNSEHLRVLKYSSVIHRFPLLGGSLIKTVTFGTKHFVHYSRHIHYMGCPLLGGFNVFAFFIASNWIAPSFYKPIFDWFHLPDLIPKDLRAFHSSLELLAFFSIFSWKKGIFFLDIAFWRAIFADQK